MVYDKQLWEKVRHLCADVTPAALKGADSGAIATIHRHEYNVAGVRCVVIETVDFC